MSKPVVFSGLVVVGALLLGLAAPASGITRPEVIRVLDVTETEAELQDGTPGFGAGDGFAFHDGLYRWAGRERGARIGSLDGVCTFISLDEATDAATVFCNVSARLPGGQIVAAGTIRFAEGVTQFAVPITGGTGRFSNVRGQVIARDIGPEESGNTALVFRLEP